MQLRLLNISTKEKRKKYQKKKKENTLPTTSNPYEPVNHFQDGTS
jgi:hypothetical protein